MQSDNIETLVKERMSELEKDFEARKASAVAEAIAEYRAEQAKRMSDPAEVDENVNQARAAMEAEFQQRMESMAQEHQRLQEVAITKAVEEAVKSSENQKKAPTKEQLKRLVEKRTGQEVARQKEAFERDRDSLIEEAVRKALTAREVELRESIIAEANGNPDQVEHMRAKVKLSRAEKEIEALKSRLSISNEQGGVNRKQGISSGQSTNDKTISAQNPSEASDITAEVLSDEKDRARPVSRVPTTTSLLPRGALSGRGGIAIRGRGLRKDGPAKASTGKIGKREAPSPPSSGKRQRVHSAASVQEGNQEEADSPAPLKKRKEELEEDEGSTS